MAEPTTERKDERRLVLVTAGRAGVGKSTVLNNLLGLKGKKGAEAKSSARSVTKYVKCYEEEKQVTKKFSIENKHM